MAADGNLINVPSVNEKGLLNFQSIIFVMYRLEFTELNLSRDYIFKISLSCLMLEYETLKIKIQMECINPNMYILRAVAELMRSRAHEHHPGIF